jgi:hypothetical protein
MLNETPNWDLAALSGAGALRSSANDMLTFLAANLGYTKTPLAAAMADEISIRRPAGGPDMQIAYNWLIQTKNGNSIVWHNGGTGGYRTYMGFDPKNRTGVVVLSNVSTAEGPDDIGRHLLDASYPLLPVAAIKDHTEVTVDTRTYDKLIGNYELAPSAIMTISRDGDALFEQLTGQGKLQIYPEGERRFFLKLVDAQISFDTDGTGNITQLILHQNGRDQPAKRLDEAGMKRAADAAAAIAKRYKDQTPIPGSDAALRRVLEELGAAQPKYDLMSTAFGDAMRRQLTQIQTTIAANGAIQSVQFKGVGPAGADIYDVRFDHVLWECRIAIDADGKVAGLNFRPL